MEIKLEKRFAIDAPAAAAWWVLRDVRAVAECMPGAEITERIDDGHYKGQVRVKLGPATAAFKGDVRVEDVDGGQRRMRLIGRGAETRGGSAASMDLVAELHETGPQTCELAGTAQVTLNGKMAAFGGRMMGQVAEQVLRQFGANFAARVQAQSEHTPAQTPTRAGAAEQQAQKPQALNAFALLRQATADLLRPGRRTKPPGTG